MKKIYDISSFVNTLTSEKVIRDLAERELSRRKSMGLSRKDLSAKSLVSYASIRRFEETGEISLSSLLKIADTLSCLEDFEKVISPTYVKDLKTLKGFNLK